MSGNILTVNPAPALLDKVSEKRTPVYLVVEDGKKSVFLATKFEFENNAFIKVVGVSINLAKNVTVDSVILNYAEFLKTDKENFVELFIPCNKISYIRNLIFKQK